MGTKGQLRFPISFAEVVTDLLKTKPQLKGKKRKPSRKTKDEKRTGAMK